MTKTNTILQLFATVGTKTAGVLLQHWQQLLPAAPFQRVQQRLFLSMWQQHARTVQQHQQQHEIPAVLQIWQQADTCWLLLSWQPEHCDLTDLWQALCPLPITSAPDIKPLSIQFEMPVQQEIQGPCQSLSIETLRHQLQHSVFQPVDLTYNDTTHNVWRISAGVCGLNLRHEQLRPAIAATLCSDNPAPLLFLTLQLPDCLAHAQLHIASVPQGLCLLHTADQQLQLAGPLLSAVQQQALLAGLQTAVPGHFNENHPDVLAESAATCATTKLYQQLQDSGFELQWGEQRWSARQLNQLVAAWQQQLLPLPAGAVIAIDVARGPAQLAACLACLFSGFAFVPLDRQLPAQRRQQQLTFLQPTLVLCDKKASAPEPCNTTTILRQTSHTALAYLMFTSGSTGTPKAVMLSREALSTFLAAAASSTGLQPGQCVLAHTSVGFDISLLELLLPLYCGAQVRLLAEQQNRLLPAEPTLLTDIDLLQGTPTLFRALLAAGWQGHRSLTLLVGGEALDSTLLRQLKKRCSRLLHCYGPTEATVWSMMAETSDPPVLGPSLPGYRHRVLSSDGAIARAGMIGELLISGRALASGYLRQDKLTVQRFVTGSDGTRWYHSGDLVRQLTADRYQYLGRLDDQIKLRGHRIEPAEIESLLQSYSSVTDCAVILLREPDRLVACLVGDQSQDAHLRSALDALLPVYMRPQLTWLQSLPSNPSGKTDKRALQMRFREPAVER